MTHINGMLLDFDPGVSSYCWFWRSMRCHEASISDKKLNGEQLIRQWRGCEISSGKGNWWLVSAVISTLCRKKTTKTERFGVKARGRWIETPLKKQMVIFLSPFTPKGCSGLWRYSILVHARALTSEMLETWVVRIVVITGAFEYPQAVHLKV